MRDSQRPISIAMLALGGQGGGVLTKWLVELAEAEHYLAQSTYIAGVAQRTGATLYCIEMFPSGRGEQLPVFAPTPIPGDVDLVIAGEMAETGRAILNGYVTPGLTTLIASTHRVYTIDEKSALGNGVVDQVRVGKIAAQAARKYIAFDMDSMAACSHCVISAVLFGAIAASGVLPFERASFEHTIRKSGRSVAGNLAGFAAGYQEASRGQAVVPDTIAKSADMPVATPHGAAGVALQKRIADKLPASVRNATLHGALKALDYQDSDYAKNYIDRVAEVCELESSPADSDAEYPVSVEVARQLALQMCYEDTIRVADLKIRPERFVRIREQVNAGENQPLKVVEYFHPRIEEICDMLPARLGAAVMNSAGVRRVLTPCFNKGRNVSTSSIGGFLLLKTIAGMKRFRRGSLRFARQKKFIDAWLDHVSVALASGTGAALAIAKSVEIVKGYGATYDRGHTRYEAIMQAVHNGRARNTADIVTRLHQAALADEEGTLFAAALAKVGEPG